MPHNRTMIIALWAAATLALAGCAGATGPAAPSPDDTAAPAATTDTSAPAATSDSGSPAATGTTLLAVIGSADDPEAYAIGILDESGSIVTSVPAGDYSLTFVDRSQMHNFHLTGEGVDVKTDVRGTDETTVEITLVAGTYTFVCDPHQGSMSGELEVTG